MIRHLHKIEELEWELEYVRLERNNLLARIFRDGGQRASQLGGEAVNAAEQIVANLFVENDELRAQLAREMAGAAQAYQDCSGFELAVRRFRERAEQAEAKLSKAMDDIHELNAIACTAPIPSADYYCPDCREHFRAPREPGPHPKQVACPKGHVHNTYEECRD